jgi:hypothetical protein
MSTTVALKAWSWSGGSCRLGEEEEEAAVVIVVDVKVVVVVVGGRGRNQLLLRSKQQRSDQLQDVRKRMTRRTEQ